MSEKRLRISQKQYEALQILHDDSTKVLLFGGGAGGSKSYLGCLWVVQQATMYANTRWVIARELSVRLMETTYLTLLDVLRNHEMKAGIHYEYRRQENLLEFKNGSVIMLKALPRIPSDPEYDYLGGLEITGAFIDEAQEVEKKAKDVLLSRIRYNLDTNGLKPKLLLTCNPSKGYLYNEFYQPWRNNTLPSNKKFLPALVTDNPYIERSYVEQLNSIEDESIKQRLLYGNWDFETADNQLVTMQWLNRCLIDDTEIGEEPLERRYGAVDVAREGSDSTVCSLFINDTLVELKRIAVPITDNTDISGKIADEIIRFYTANEVGFDNIYIDAVGVGGGVIDSLRGKGYYAKSYKGGEPAKSRNEFTSYNNLRSYSYWQVRLAIQKGELKISKQCNNLDELFRELTATEYIIDDKVVKLVEKEKIKRKLGRSPDFADAMVMGYAPQSSNDYGIVF